MSKGKKRNEKINVGRRIKVKRYGRRKGTRKGKEQRKEQEKKR